MLFNCFYDNLTFYFLIPSMLTLNEFKYLKNCLKTWGCEVISFVLGYYDYTVYLYLITIKEFTKINNLSDLFYYDLDLTIDRSIKRAKIT